MTQGKCAGCGKTTRKIPFRSPMFLNKNLDLAEYYLHQAWITDVSSEYRNAVSQLIQAIQKLKSPNEPKSTLAERLELLYKFTYQIGQGIECEKCRQSYYYDVVESVGFHHELELGHYKHALRIYVNKELKKTWWLLRALWTRKVLPSLKL